MWYVVHDFQAVGPFSLEQVKQFLDVGMLNNSHSLIPSGGKSDKAFSIQSVLNPKPTFSLGRRIAAMLLALILLLLLYNVLVFWHQTDDFVDLFFGK